MPPYLLVRCTEHVLGIPIDRVIETMRPPRVEAVPHAPAWLAGTAMIRGEATAVLALGVLLQLRTRTPARLVMVRLATRRVGVLVDTVDRVARLENVAALSGLLPFVDAGVVSHLSQKDGELVSLLDVVRLVSEERLSEALA